MLITCISASNTRLMGENSTSTRVCHMIGDIIESAYGKNAYWWKTGGDHMPWRVC